MKKITALLLAIAMVLSLAACGGGGAATTPAPSESTPAESNQPAPDTIKLLKNQNKELMEKIDKLNRELGDKERQIIELKKERAQYLMAAESADVVPYGLAK